MRRVVDEQLRPLAKVRLPGRNNFVICPFGYLYKAGGKNPENVRIFTSFSVNCYSYDLACPGVSRTTLY
jgi:hypothetical protein